MECKVRLHHFAISVEDLERSVAWYHDNFGLEVLHRMVIEHNQTRVAFVGNDQWAIEILEVPAHKPIPEYRLHPDTDNAVCGIKHFCIITDDNRAFIDRLKSRGVNVCFEYQPEGTGPESYCAFINDPDGNVIEVFDSRNSVIGYR